MRYSAQRVQYARVNAEWPQGVKLPPLDEREAISAVKRLYRKWMKRPFKGKFVITSGNRNTWVYHGEFRVNASAGWHDLVHCVSHYVHSRLNPGAPGHGWQHHRIERDMIAYVVASGWLDGKLKPKAKPPIPPAQKRAAATVAAIARWEKKLKRAENALKKLRARKRYYDKKTA